jgi:O-antigen/teichoic acid export membrane protein
MKSAIRRVAGVLIPLTTSAVGLLLILLRLNYIEHNFVDASLALSFASFSFAALIFASLLYGSVMNRASHQFLFLLGFTLMEVFLVFVMAYYALRISDLFSAYLVLVAAFYLAGFFRWKNSELKKIITLKREKRLK